MHNPLLAGNSIILSQAGGCWMAQRAKALYSREEVPCAFGHTPQQAVTLLIAHEQGSSTWPVSLEDELRRTQKYPKIEPKAERPTHTERKLPEFPMGVPFEPMKLPPHITEFLDTFSKNFIEYTKAKIAEALAEPNNARVTGSMNQEKLT